MSTPQLEKTTVAGNAIKLLRLGVTSVLGLVGMHWTASALLCTSLRAACKDFCLCLSFRVQMKRKVNLFDSSRRVCGGAFHSASPVIQSFEEHVSQKSALYPQSTGATQR